MYQRLKSFFKSKIVKIKQDMGFEQLSLTKEEILTQGQKCYDVFREPQAIYNAEGEVMGASFVYEPILDPVNEEHLEKGHKFLYLHGEFFELDGTYIRNMKFYLENGKDEPVFRRVMRYNWHLVLKALKLIGIGLVLYITYKIGKGV